MQVGYLGVGNMGQPMAEKLLDGGHGLVVFDISEAAMDPLLRRQARRAASPKEVGDQCEIVVVSLPTLAAFRAAVLGPEGLAAGRALKVLLNTCTVGVPFLHEVEAALAPNGVTIVDCPISGGPAGARAGTLSVMVSGDPAAVEKVQPLISLWGQMLTIAGDKPGAAQVLKLGDGERDQRRQRPQRGNADGAAECGAGSLVRLRCGDAYSDEGYRPRHSAGRGIGHTNVGLSGRALGLQARDVRGFGR